jgi:hypothetical protein
MPQESPDGHERRGKLLVTTCLNWRKLHLRRGTRPDRTALGRRPWKSTEVLSVRLDASADEPQEGSVLCLPNRGRH